MSQGLQVDIEFSYSQGFALDVRFFAPAGIVTQIVGPSGSGKSTLLALIAGLKTPNAGTISIDQQALFSSKQSIDVAPWRRRIGLLFQGDTLFPHLSVKQNLCFGSKQKVHVPWSLESICDVFEMADLLDRKPPQLSGGQRDRVRLGRTLLSQPNALLLDEPLNSVEENLRERIFRFVCDGAASRAVPLVLVSHDTGLQSQATGAIWRFDRGNLRNTSAT